MGYMLRWGLTALLVAIAAVAQAQTCPDFLRFADFGIEQADGSFSRGGVILRGIGADAGGDPILKLDETECRDVTDLLKDGRGNPIPVVTHIAYDTAKAGLDLIELSLSYSKDARRDAAENLKAHLANTERDEVILARTSLCAIGEEALSCQLVSPYPGNVELVVYCEGATCQMPVLAVAETIYVSASWEMDWTDGKVDAGERLTEKVQEVHEFLEPMSTGF